VHGLLFPMRQCAAVAAGECRACGSSAVDVDGCMPGGARRATSLWPELCLVEELVRLPGVCAESLLLAVLPAHATSAQYYYLVFMTGRLQSLNRRADLYGLVADLHARARVNDTRAVPPLGML